MIHPLNNGTGFSRAWKAFNCSLKGFVAAVKHESAFRQELGLACIFLPTGAKNSPLRIGLYCPNCRATKLSD
jgi:diacylglycerol kinase